MLFLLYTVFSTALCTDKKAFGNFFSAKFVWGSAFVTFVNFFFAGIDSLLITGNKEINPDDDNYYY